MLHVSGVSAPLTWTVTLTSSAPAKLKPRTNMPEMVRVLLGEGPAATSVALTLVPPVPPSGGK